MAPIVYLIGVGTTRRLIPGYYYWTRWTDPGILLLIASFCIGYATIWHPDSKKIWPHFPVIPPIYNRIGRIALGIILLLVCYPSFTQSFQERRSHFMSDSRAIYRINVQAGLWIHEHVPQNAIVGVNDAGAIRYFGKRYTVDLLGLNNHEIAFRKKDFTQIFSEVDWLAIFPIWFRPQRQIIDENFVPQQVFSLPLEEYTICNCPGQNIKVIFKNTHK